MTAKRAPAKAAAHERGTRNVYADLGSADPAGSLVKAQLVTKIAEILTERGYTQTRAASMLGIPQPKLSKILRGEFRGISERRLMDCLTALGSDVAIVVRARKGSRGIGPGSVSVVFA